MVVVIHEEGKPKKGIKIGPATAKSEELEAMRLIAGTDSYLSSLFSVDFVKWATNRIRDDFPIDLMDEYRGLEVLLRQYKGENEKADRELEALRKAAKERDEALEDIARTNQATVAKYQAEQKRLEDKINEQSEYLYEERRKVARLEETIDLRDMEIIRLKARLFDLLVEEKK